jgi:hypothetical protein
VRDAGLLHDRVTGPQQNFSVAHHESDLTAQDRYVVERVGGVRALELSVVRLEFAVGSGLPGSIRLSFIRRDLDDAEARSAIRRWRRLSWSATSAACQTPRAPSWCSGPRG